MVNFIINITKGFLENKFETLAIYNLIKLEYNDRYSKRGDYQNAQEEKDWLHTWGKSLRILFFVKSKLFLCGYFWPVVKLFKYLMSFMM